MIEYTGHERSRPRPYCWICRGYGCDIPGRACGEVSTWSPASAVPPTLTGDEPWCWLNGPPAAWWCTRAADTAA